MDNVLDFNALLAEANRRDSQMEYPTLDKAKQTCKRVETLLQMALEDKELMSDIIEVCFDGRSAMEFDDAVTDAIKNDPDGSIAQALKNGLSDYV